MSAFVTKEQVQELIKGSESVAGVLKGSVAELSSEAINLFIVNSLIEIMKFAVVFVIFFIVKKYVDVMLQTTENKKYFSALKTTALVLSLVYFTFSSVPHVKDIAKAMVAPKLFLAEKAKDLVK